MENDFFRNEEMTLLDLLDGVIDKGAMLWGDIVISVADIDLIWIDLKLLVTSIETAFPFQLGENENQGGDQLYAEDRSSS